MPHLQKFECDEIHFRSWRDFKAGYAEHLNREIAQKKIYPYLFRGQGDVRWPLQTKFARDLGSLPGKSASKRKALLQSFRHQLELAGREHVHELDDVSAWALGQHYELPTPLLDWSDSPYVAAFFACETAASCIRVSLPSEVKSLNDRLAVFAIRHEGNQTHWDNMRVKFVRDYDPENKRIRPQLGLFTMTKATDDPLEQVVGRYCYDSKKKLPMSRFLLKFTLPYSEALSALRDLEKMDITARRIYADLDGTSRSAALKVRLDILGQF